MTLRTPIVQFGTSRFLQAHADLFFDQGTPARGVTVVQTSGDPGRAERLKAMADPAGYPVRIRGMSNGKTVEDDLTIKSVKRTLSTATDWDELVRVVTHEAEFIISNTSDTGFDPKPADCDAGPSQAQSYPAKLYHLLVARHAANKPPLTIFPMELIPENGMVLKARVLEIAADLGAADGMIDWLNACIWANSLVDRIVSEPIEPVGAVAESYALWAIEAQDGLSAPTGHPAIRVVPDLEQIERLKLHILNLGHTVMAAFWIKNGQPDDIVRDLLKGQTGQRMLDVFKAEVMPGFALRGMETQAIAYLDETLDRFANPFLDHRIADIAQNHSQKIERRIAAFVEWVRQIAPDFDAPTLDAIIAGDM